MRLSRIALLLAASLQVAFANDQLRDWTLASGEKHRAEIIAYDEPNKTVTIRRDNGDELEIQESNLSAIDQAWILQWVEKDEEARDLLARIGGTVTLQQGTGKFSTAYAVYQPPGASATSPMLILFHPSGNGTRKIYSYIEAAAATGMTLVSLDFFRNTTNDPDDDINELMLERFTALLPQIETTVPHDPNRIFMGGSSGGAHRAYYYSAMVKRPWAGIYANGGWLGGEKRYHHPYPALKVAMVNGDKDRGANHWIDPDTERLQQAGGIVSIHAFEGGHQLAPPSVMAKAFRWLIDTPAPEPQQPPVP